MECERHRHRPIHAANALAMEEDSVELEEDMEDAEITVEKRFLLRRLAIKCDYRSEDTQSPITSQRRSREVMPFWKQQNKQRMTIGMRMLKIQKKRFPRLMEQKEKLHSRWNQYRQQSLMRSR